MAKEKQKLQIIPLGGLGEIGKNMTVVRYGDEILLIDAGLMFPDEEMLGIDLGVNNIHDALGVNRIHDFQSGFIKHDWFCQSCH